MTRLLLVDDHPVVREGIRRILRNAFADLIVGEAGTGEQAMGLFESEEWDLVLLDLSLPGISGLEVIGKMRAVRPDARIIVVSVHSPHHFARRALAAGAMGYLEKRTAPEQILQAAAAVMAGRTFVSSATGTTSEPSDPRARRLAHDELSDREYQVLRMLGVGRTVSEIASELALSVKTISTYRTRTLQKMGLRTTAELMHYVIDHGLVP
jgi:two-component system invasion response regulator UvrY